MQQILMHVGLRSVGMWGCKLHTSESNTKRADLSPAEPMTEPAPEPAARYSGHSAMAAGRAGWMKSPLPDLKPNTLYHTQMGGQYSYYTWT